MQADAEPSDCPSGAIAGVSFAPMFAVRWDHSSFRNQTPFPDLLRGHDAESTMVQFVQIIIRSKSSLTLLSASAK